jgi:hypothetical protein
LPAQTRQAGGVSGRIVSEGSGERRIVIDHPVGKSPLGAVSDSPGCAAGERFDPAWLLMDPI